MRKEKRGCQYGTPYWVNYCVKLKKAYLFKNKKKEIIAPTNHKK